MPELGILITLARIAGVHDYHKYYQYNDSQISAEITKLCTYLDALEQEASNQY